MDYVTEMIKLLLFVIFLVSVSGLMVIAGTIITNKKLQAHPQPMIAVICIVEACMSFNALIVVLNPMQVICYFSSYRILSRTYLNFDASDDELR